MICKLFYSQNQICTTLSKILFWFDKWFNDVQTCLAFFLSGESSNMHINHSHQIYLMFSSVSWQFQVLYQISSASPGQVRFVRSIICRHWIYIQIITQSAKPLVISFKILIVHQSIFGLSKWEVLKQSQMDKIWTQQRLLSQLGVSALPKGCAFHLVANACAKLYSFGSRGDVCRHDVSFRAS